MLMAFAGGFYVMNDHLGGGARLASRINYSFHKSVAFNIGVDFDYAAVQFDEIRNGFQSKSTYHILNLGVNFGFTFFI